MGEGKKQLFISMFGPPGSGKSTQADILAEYFNLEHINTGKLISEFINDPINKDNPIAHREKYLHNNGFLATSDWVIQLQKDAIEKAAKHDKGVVFSGFMRRTEELGMMPFLEEFCGRENIFFVEIKLSDEIAIYRNTHRRICEKNKHPLVFSEENAKLENCPVCGSKLVTRELDNAETIKLRIKIYKENLVPIFKGLKEMGYEIMEVDGAPSSEEVTKVIVGEIERKLGK